MRPSSIPGLLCLHALILGRSCVVGLEQDPEHKWKENIPLERVEVYTGISTSLFT